MGNKRIAWLAWALCGLTICIAAGLIIDNLTSVPASTSILNILGGALSAFVMPIVCGIVGALIVSRQPRNTIGWLLLLPVLLVLVEGPIGRYIEHIAPLAPAPTPPLLLLAWFSGWSWLLLIFPLLHIPLLFPNGQPPSPRWRWVSRAAIAWAAFFIAMTTFSEPIGSGTTPNLTLHNPIGFMSDHGDLAGIVSGAWIAGLLILIVLCVAALVVRYRRANETERRQIKWLLYACTIFLAIYVSGSVTRLGDTTSLVADIWNIVFGLSLGTFPVAIGIAILRHRLYDIDIIIRRTLIYSALTLILGLVYAGSIVLLQQLVVPLTGHSQAAVVASTLLIAALFSPLRRRIQNLIDQRFYRRKYDAARVLAAFGIAARDETDLERLTAEMLRVVDETLQPEFATLWLQPADRAQHVE